MKDRVAVVTMNRPEKRNAIDSALHEGLELILEDLSTDPDVGAIVLTGAGKAFCAGGDISTMGDTIQDRSPLHYTRGPKYLIQAFANCEAPIIAAVNGPAAGLGATIALMCDVIYMSDQARIGDTHVQVGLVAGDGGAVIWPLLIGPARAKEFLMRGHLVNGSEAAQMGLVNYAVPAEEVMPKARALAQELADGPTWAIRWSKLSVNKWLKDQVNLILDASLAYEMITMTTEDHKEATRAFVEKRKPQFQGR
jgi:enoyl-CoA hydratase/carnithine racemase